MNLLDEKGRDSASTHRVHIYIFFFSLFKRGEGLSQSPKTQHLAQTEFPTEPNYPK
jgi:hypothetical protein